MLVKKYSELSIAVDIISDTYNTHNPIILSEKIEQDLGLEYTIHQISDYLCIDRIEDFEKESLKQEYNINY